MDAEIDKHVLARRAVKRQIFLAKLIHSSNIPLWQRTGIAYIMSIPKKSRIHSTFRLRLLIETLLGRYQIDCDELSWKLGLWLGKKAGNYLSVKDRIRVCIATGKEALRHNHREEAIQLTRTATMLARSIDQPITYIECQTHLGLQLLEEGSLIEALPHLDEAYRACIELSPVAISIAAWNYIEVASANGRIEQAINACELLVAAQREIRNTTLLRAAWALRGEVGFLACNFNDAAYALDKAISIPGNVSQTWISDVWARYALALALSGQIETADEIFQREWSNISAYKIWASNFLRYRAWMLYETGKSELAKAIFKQLIKPDTSIPKYINGQAFLGLSRCSLLDGDNEKAQYWIQQSILVWQSLPKFRYELHCAYALLARCQARLCLYGQCEANLSLIKEFLTVHEFPRLKLYYLQALGELADQLGNSREACKYYNSGKELALKVKYQYFIDWFNLAAKKKIPHSPKRLGL